MELLALVITGIIGTATAAAAIFAGSEAYRLRQASTLPEVAVYIEPVPEVPEIVHLVVRNVGHGAAHQVTFEQQIRPVPQKMFYDQDIFILKDQLRYLAPGSELRFAIGPWSDIGDTPFQVVANYFAREYDKRMGDQPIKSTYIMDPRQSIGVSHLTDEERRAAKALGDAMRKLANGQVTIKIKS